MQQDNAIAILRHFEAHRGTIVRDTKQWSWTANAICFPDAICPWCSGAMHSNAVWLVDENAQRLLGQVRFVGGRAVREPASHPHVNPDGDGSICLGGHGVETAYQALFIAFNLNSMYWDSDNPKVRENGVWGKWLRKLFDHSCGVKVVGGLSAELARAAVSKRVEMAKVDVAADSIFQPNRLVEPPLRARRRTSATSDYLFDGTMGSGITI